MVIIIKIIELENDVSNVCNMLKDILKHNLHIDLGIVAICGTD